TYALQVSLGARDAWRALREVRAADDAWAEGDPWVYGTWGQVRIGAALAHIMSGEPEGAMTELEPVFDISPEYRVVTIVGRMGAIARTLEGDPYQGSDTARALQERIRAFRAESLEHKATAALEGQ